MSMVFYANVNPNVDHPRWSQKKKREFWKFFSNKILLMYNGYEKRGCFTLYRNGFNKVYMMKRFFIYFTAFFLPIVYLLIRLFVIDDVNDPIKYIYTITGVSATVILFISISISLIKEKINLMKYRKEIGLLGFFYAFYI